MALIVEDGSIVADANSYASTATADIYFQARGNADWAALTEPEKEAALIKAADYLEAAYSQAWKGERVAIEQTLSWPRFGVYVDGFELPSDEVPQRVVNAAIELALRASAGELLSDQGQRVLKEKVDVLEVTYQDYSDPTERYTFVSKLVAPYLTGGSGAGGFQQARLRRT